MCSGSAVNNTSCPEVSGVEGVEGVDMTSEAATACSTFPGNTALGEAVCQDACRTSLERSAQAGFGHIRAAFDRRCAALDRIWAKSDGSCAGFGQIWVWAALAQVSAGVDFDQM